MPTRRTRLAVLISLIGMGLPWSARADGADVPASPPSDRREALDIGAALADPSAAVPPWVSGERLVASIDGSTALRTTTALRAHAAGSAPHATPWALDVVAVPAETGLASSFERDGPIDRIVPIADGEEPAASAGEPPVAKPAQKRRRRRQHPEPMLVDMAVPALRRTVAATPLSLVVPPHVGPRPGRDPRRPRIEARHHDTRANAPRTVATTGTDDDPLVALLQVLPGRADEAPVPYALLALRSGEGRASVRAATVFQRLATEFARLGAAASANGSLERPSGSELFVPPDPRGESETVVAPVSALIATIGATALDSTSSERRGKPAAGTAATGRRPVRSDAAVGTIDRWTATIAATRASQKRTEPVPVIVAADRPSPVAVAHPIDVATVECVDYDVFALLEPPADAAVVVASSETFDIFAPLPGFERPTTTASIRAMAMRRTDATPTPVFDTTRVARAATTAVLAGTPTRSAVASGEHEIPTLARGVVPKTAASASTMLLARLDAPVTGAATLHDTVLPRQARQDDTAIDRAMALLDATRGKRFEPVAPTLVAPVAERRFAVAPLLERSDGIVVARALRRQPLLPQEMIDIGDAAALRTTVLARSIDAPPPGRDAFDATHRMASLASALSATVDIFDPRLPLPAAAMRSHDAPAATPPAVAARATPARATPASSRPIATEPAATTAITKAPDADRARAIAATMLGLDRATVAASDRSRPVVETSAAAAIGDDRPGADRLDPLGGALVAVDDARLQQMRGGFETDGGLKISFGIERAVYINGALVTTTALNVADLGKLTAAQTAGLDAATVGLIQSGPNNAYAPGQLGPSSVATVIQNTLNNQHIQGITQITATVNSLDLMRRADLQSRIQSAITDSLRR